MKENQTRKEEQKLVVFRGCQIPKIEAEFLQAIESQVNEQFTPVKDGVWTSKMGFLVENNRVKEIKLIECELTILPEDIGCLDHLTVLRIRDCNLSTLPTSIGRLFALQQLLLSENEITTLPNSIGDLRSLRLLTLSKNKLTALPENIGNLKSLTLLSLEENELSSLPKSIGTLSIFPRNTIVK